MARRRSQADEQVLLRMLHDSPVFRSGTPQALAALAAEAAPFDYPAGSFLFRQGEPAAHVLVLTAGEVAIVSPVRGGAEQVHSIVGPGQLIGELALLTGGRRTAGARATSPTTVWAIGRWSARWPAPPRCVARRSAAPARRSADQARRSSGPARRRP